MSSTYVTGFVDSAMFDLNAQKGMKADKDKEPGMKWGGWLILAIGSPGISSIKYELF